ncbi:DinB family protein [Ichthyenterobacterium magnum]|uniref:DinB family protein n=1 Tax=Ichthyenterobacterium magnum TaxID=1230530 RepID=A0A420DV28_9FLAO|nr:DinB family protein [Ichthyenterobacterium magnum]RKE98033.1 DinB family protein [Ichthyenterobacterium magnum]
MKNLLLTFLFITTITYGSTNSELKKNDRAFAINYLEMTLQQLVDEIKNLSKEELLYTPKDGGWSIMNCLEHIASTEPAIIEGAKKLIIKNEVLVDKDLTTNDGLVITNVTDRTKKVKSPELFNPSNKWTSLEEVMKVIKANRASTIKLLKETNADLRHLIGKYAYGDIDAYQLFIVSAAHGYRHTLQIREILDELKSDKTEESTD